MGALDVILVQGKMYVFSRRYFVHEGIGQLLETYLDIPTGGKKRAIAVTLLVVSSHSEAPSPWHRGIL